MCKIDGAIGKKLAQQAIPKKKACEEGKILNPTTNRCVKVDGAIGRRLLLASKVRASPQRLDKLPHDIIGEIVKKMGVAMVQVYDDDEDDGAQDQHYEVPVFVFVNEKRVRGRLKAPPKAMKVGKRQSKIRVR